MNLILVETPAQIEAVAAMARDIWTRHYVPIVGADQVDYMLDEFQSPAAIARQIASEGFEYYLASGLGYMALVPDIPHGQVLLSKLYVQEQRRGSGLGRAMVAFAASRCVRWRCPELWLTVNKHNTGAIAFYERMGFRITGPLIQDIGGGFIMDDWRMALQIAHGDTH